MLDQQSLIRVPVIYLAYQLAALEPDTTTVIYAKVYGRFIEIKQKFWRKKLHKMNQGFLEVLLATETVDEPQSNIIEKGNPSISPFLNQ